jgi:cation transport regulator ChaB
VKPKTYRSNEELPEALRTTMPAEAQSLYRATYNRVVEKCLSGKSGDGERIAGDAHEAAMLSVQREFSRGEDGRWRRDSIGEHMHDVGPRKGR